MRLPRFARPKESYYVLFIPGSIFLAKLLEILLRIFNIEFASPPDPLKGWYISNFIEWFGVLYGILLPLILVRVWEQLDDIDREFDREADTVRILYEDTFFLRRKDIKFGKEISNLLQEYVRHVRKNYKNEVNKSGTERVEGDQILERIRGQYQELIYSDMLEQKVSKFLVPELINRLNDLIDIRGDRIGLSSQRLFESLRIVALITSILFVLPFYFVSFSLSAGLLDNILSLGVTLLVIFIYVTIDDLDEPFGGSWRVSDDSWRRIRRDIICSERQFELKTRGQKSPLLVHPIIDSIAEPVPPQQSTDTKKPGKKIKTPAKSASVSSRQKPTKKTKSR